MKTAFRPPVRVLPLLLILAAAATGLIPCVRAQTPVRVLRSTDIAPGTGGQTYESYRFIGFDRAGSLWFSGPGRQTGQGGIWKIPRGGTPVLVLSAGDPGPGAEAGVSMFMDPVFGQAVAPDGSLAFMTRTDSGAPWLLFGPAPWQAALRADARLASSNDTFRSLKALSVQDGRFFAALGEQNRRTGEVFNRISIHSGTPGTTSLDLTEGDPSPLGSPWKTIDRQSLLSTADLSYSFLGKLDNNFNVLALRKRNEPLRAVVSTGGVIPGTTRTLTLLTGHSRADDGTIAFAGIATEEDSSNTSIYRVFTGTDASFVPVPVSAAQLGHASVQSTSAAQLTALPGGGLLFVFSYEYPVAGTADRQRASALVRARGAASAVLVNRGDAAPGFPAGWTFRPDVSGLTAFTGQDGTGMFFTLVSDGLEFRAVLYSFGSPGGLTLLAREGQPMEISPGGGTAPAEELDTGFHRGGSGFTTGVPPRGSLEFTLGPDPDEHNFFDVFAVHAPAAANAQTYAQWAQVLGAGAPAEDDDRDGLPNLLEWAFGLDPKAAAPDATSITGGAANPGFTYSRSTAALQAGAVFTVEWSAGLSSGPWSAEGVSESVLSDDGTHQRIRAEVPSGGAAGGFVRLKVTAP